MAGRSRLILRKERPHPGAQLTFTDIDGMRVTALLTNTPAGVVPFQAAGLELRHRQHARVEDRIREAKATGLRNLPCREFNENQAWLETVLTAVDLICWTKQICFADVVELARCEIAAIRYRVLHVAARLTRSARQLRLRIDKTWRWAAQIAEGFDRLRAHSPDTRDPVARPEEPGDRRPAARQPGSASRPARHAHNRSNPLWRHSTPRPPPSGTHVKEAG